MLSELEPLGASAKRTTATTKKLSKHESSSSEGSDKKTVWQFLND
jgi:hypothetical protein